MSNVERQRLFRKRHPGYFGKYKVSAKEAARQTAALLASLGLQETGETAAACATMTGAAAEAQGVDPELARAVASA